MPDSLPKYGHSFTTKYGGRVREIDSAIYIKSSFEKDFSSKQYRAIWDTGATRTVIVNI